MAILKKGIWMMGIPFYFSVMAVINHSVLWFVLFVLAHFAVLRIVPAFRHFESLGMFVTVALSTIPVNMYLLIALDNLMLFPDSFFFVGILRNILCYIMLLSVEEIVMGTITRWIWRKQYKSIV